MADVGLRSKATTFDSTVLRLSLVAISLLYFCASWTNAFGFGRWFYAPTILVCVVSALAVMRAIKDRDFRLAFTGSDLAFIGFLGWTAVACVMSPNAKTLGYVYAYTFTFIGMAIILRLAVTRYSLYLPQFYRTNEFGVLLVCCFCLVEFVSRYSVGMSIQNIVPRGVDATAVYFIFPRVYGFSEEPTYLCWYLNTLGLLAVYTQWTLRGRGARPRVFTAIVTTTWGLTFSAAGFAFLLLSLAVAVVVWLIKNSGNARRAAENWRTWLWNGLLVGAVILILCFVLTRDYRPVLAGVFNAVHVSWKPTGVSLIDLTSDAASGSSTFLQGMLEKVTLTEDHGIPRIQQWRNHLQLALQHPWFGLGPGYFSSQGEDSSLNLFIFVAAEQGLPAMVLLVVGFALTGLRILRSSIRGAPIFLAGYTAGTAHLLTMTQHFHPALWLLVAAFFAAEAADARSQPRYRAETR